jgi:hypothetical protein
MSIIETIEYHKKICGEFSEDSKTFKLFYIFLETIEEAHHVLWAQKCNVEKWVEEQEKKVKDKKGLK